MKKVNKSRYAILGSLACKPLSGYELKRFMQQSTDFFWQESDASIYPMLKKLAAEGKIAPRREYVGKRGRTIFEITETGKQELLRWLVLPAEDETHRSEFLLKLFLGANISKDEVMQQLMLQQQKVEKLGREFKMLEEEFTQVSDEYPHKLFWTLTLNNGIMHVKAEERWLADCLKMLKK